MHDKQTARQQPPDPASSLRYQLGPRAVLGRTPEATRTQRGIDRCDRGFHARRPEIGSPIRSIETKAAELLGCYEGDQAGFAQSGRSVLAQHDVRCVFLVGCSGAWRSSPTGPVVYSHLILTIYKELDRHTRRHGNPSEGVGPVTQPYALSRSIRRI